MKIFSFKRLLGMAAIYGAVRYVRANGGAKAVFDDLSSKARGLVDNAKSKADDVKNMAENSFASGNTGRNQRMSENPSGRASSYASYDLDNDDKLRH